MIRRCTSTIDEDFDIAVLGDLAEDGFSHRRAAYVAQTYDENVSFRCHERIIKLGKPKKTAKGGRCKSR